MQSRNSTALLNSTTSLTRTEGFGGYIAPTPLERAMGRLMRAPDHDGGDAGASGSDAGADAGADAGSDAGGGDAGDEGSGDAGGDGADKPQDDDSTTLGAASTDEGAGDDQEGGDKDGKDGEGDKAETDGPPETYELKVTVKGEDGKDEEVPIDAELLAKATPVLKDLKLTNEQANKVASLVPEIQQRVIQQQADDFAATRADWAKAAQADKEIGGKNWASTKSLAAKALDAFGAPSEIKEIDGKKVETNPFRVILNQSGLGEHPDMIRIFRNVGAALSEDGTFLRGDAKTVKKSREEELYPDDVPKK